MEPDKQIMAILAQYDERNQKDILEAVAIRLGYSCTLIREAADLDDDDDDDPGFNDPAPWAD